VLRFLAGVVAGALAIWMWGDELRDYLIEQTRHARVRTADQIQAVQQQITSTLQSGQDAIRPSDETRRVRPTAR
jgi:hypothetical protein